VEDWVSRDSFAKTLNLNRGGQLDGGGAEDFSVFFQGFRLLARMPY
jgi:hypothetical protein